MNSGHPMTSARPSELDWRIGIGVKTKLRSHHLWMERGTVQDVHPDGHYGIADKHGVLEIRMSNGQIIMVPSEEWVTA